MALEQETEASRVKEKCEEIKEEAEADLSEKDRFLLVTLKCE